MIYRILTKHEELESETTKQLKNMLCFLDKIASEGKEPWKEKNENYCDEGIDLLMSAKHLSLDIAQMAVLYKSIEFFGLNDEPFDKLLQCKQLLERLVVRATELRDIAEQIKNYLVNLDCERPENAFDFQEKIHNIH